MYKQVLKVSLTLSILSVFLFLTSCYQQVKEIVDVKLDKNDLVKLLNSEDYLKKYPPFKAETTDEGLKIVLPNSATFDSSGNVKSQARTALFKVVKVYKDEIRDKYPDNDITVVGYYFSGANDEDNKKKSEGYANKIVQVLKSLGVSEYRLHAFGKGNKGKGGDRVEIYIDLE